MQSALKSLENNALAALTRQAPKGVMQAIEKASAQTGVSFSYLVQKAGAESAFNPTVKAKTSSATGLFQFIESTWMDMVQKHGDKYGIDTKANKSDILDMRKDPAVASFMAAEFAKDNAQHLERTVGGEIGDTELYFAHFMGAGGASAFLSQLKKNPMAVAADLFPKEARANKNVFYNSKTGTPKTLQEVYDFFDKKFVGENHVVERGADSVQTMAHKPKSGAVKAAGYQHIPPQNPRSLSVESAAYHSLFGGMFGSSTVSSFMTAERAGRGMDSLFGTQQTGGAFPAFFYDRLSNQTSLFLSLLKQD